MQMTPYSPSSLLLFRNCPRQYKVNYIEKRKRKSSPQMERGSLVHRWIQEYVVQGKKPGYSVEDFDEKKQDRLTQFLFPLAPHLFVSSEWKVGLDREKKFIDFDSPLCYLRGVIDFIAGDKERKHGILIDWKTGKSVAEVFQIEVYSWILYCLLPSFSFSFFFFYVDRKRGEDVKEIVVRKPEEIGQDIEEISQGIEKETEWKGKTSFRCAFCEQKEECEEYKSKGENKLSSLVTRGFCLAG